MSGSYIYGGDPAGFESSYYYGDGEPNVTASRLGGFEMVSMEPAWRRAIRLRKEAKNDLRAELESRRTRKPTRKIERDAANEALSDEPSAIEAQLQALMSELSELKPTIAVDLPGIGSLDKDYMLQIATEVVRIQQEDDEAAAMLLLY